MSKTIFNLEEKEFIRRRSRAVAEHGFNPPITAEHALVSCFSGSMKLLNAHKDMLRDIYRSVENQAFSNKSICVG